MSVPIFWGIPWDLLTQLAKNNGYGYLEETTLPDGTVLPYIQAMHYAAAHDVGDYAAAAGGAVPVARLVFDAGTADADPGPGKVRLDSASQAGATFAYVDLADADGIDITGLLATFGASTSVTKGTLGIRHATDRTKWVIYTVTGLTSPAGYRKVGLTPVAASSSSPFAAGDVVALGFVRTGDAGSGAPAATETAAGLTEIATQAEVTAGTDDFRYVTPLKLAQRLAAGVVANLPREARTSNTQLVTADKGKLIDVTTGTFSQTFAAAAVLGGGWNVLYRNSGTGVVTLDPNGAETIGGQATCEIDPGELALITCDGTNLQIAWLAVTRQVRLTASGNYTARAGIFRAKRTAIGGGGGGGRSTDTTTNPPGGGAGARCEDVASVVPGVAVPVTIGAGGTGATVASTAGTNGGTTTIGTLSAGGGLGGSATNSSPGVTAGGTATGGSLNVDGEPGWSFSNGNTNRMSRGGSTLYGTGGYLSNNGTVTPSGFGAAGAGNVNNPGQDGRPGLVIVEELA